MSSPFLKALPLFGAKQTQAVSVAKRYAGKTAVTPTLGSLCFLPVTPALCCPCLTKERGYPRSIFNLTASFPTSYTSQPTTCITKNPGPDFVKAVPSDDRVVRRLKQVTTSNQIDASTIMEWSRLIRVQLVRP
jgi:hypothetical protein